jgi:preprotein translocase subunit SecB
MTDTPTPPPAPQGPSISVLRQFIKDLSFENPGAQTREQPKIELGIDVGVRGLDGAENTYEVALKLKAQAGASEATLFLLEMEYAGLFRLDGMSPADTEAILLIECPRILFPFARRIVADLTAEGGFPPLRIDPVDFAALYSAQKQARLASGDAAAAPADGTGQA